MRSGKIYDGEDPVIVIMTLGTSDAAAGVHRYQLDISGTTEISLGFGSRGGMYLVPWAALPGTWARVSVSGSFLNDAPGTAGIAMTWRIRVNQTITEPLIASDGDEVWSYSYSLDSPTGLYYSQGSTFQKPVGGGWLKLTGALSGAMSSRAVYIQSPVIQVLAWG